MSMGDHQPKLLPLAHANVRLSALNVSLNYSHVNML